MASPPHAARLGERRAGASGRLPEHSPPHRPPRLQRPGLLPDTGSRWRGRGGGSSPKRDKVTLKWKWPASAAQTTGDGRVQKAI